MITRVLIANRGEIAIRLARGARSLGIAPVGIASEADRHALHCRAMDDYRIIGPAPAAQSYLDPARIIQAAHELGADAIHPGYGFLSERADFARAVSAAGLIFVGPPERALELAGDKRLARRLAREIEIPTLDGYDAENQEPEQLMAAAQALGFPLYIKACNGGGGRGQRLVRHNHEFAEQLAAAKREALAAFGDDKVILERYLEKPRHIEFQILADTHGTVIHLGERDCSSQRRRQKVIEEAPAPHLSPVLRAEMGAAAITFARAANYCNAGTVEFLLDQTGQFSFLEMNARLQVEHPITEAITGVDLVAWQFRIASGEALPPLFAAAQPGGWAFEARICAEDPSHDLMPSSGTITTWQAPSGPDIRLDSGVEAGSVIPLDYDSLLAKLIIWDHTRDGALQKLTQAVQELRIEGIATNQAFLLDLLNTKTLQAGTMSTDWIDTHYHYSPQPALPSPPGQVVLALAAALLVEYDWRINAIGRQLLLTLNDQLIAYRASYLLGSWHLERQDAILQTLLLPGQELRPDLPRELILTIDASPPLNAQLHMNVYYQGESAQASEPARVSGLLHIEATHCTIKPDGKKSPFEVRLRPALESKHLATSSRGTSDRQPGHTIISSPMPGRLIRVLVQTGDQIEDHQVLAILEAMKMEHRIEAPGTGVVKNVFCAEGDILVSGAAIVELASE